MISNPVLAQMLDPKWVIACPRLKCGNHAVGKTELNDGIHAVCPRCNFRIQIPWEWYHLRATEMFDHLVKLVHPLSEESARAWINSVKYTHPSYQISQVAEREAAKKEFKEVVLLAVQGTSGEKIKDDTHILIIGSNSCCELDNFPIPFSGESVLAVDASEASLRLGVDRYPKSRFCCEFVEKLNGESRDLNGNTVGNPLLGSFDLCLALRVFQSSRLPLWAALTRIRDAVRPGAKVIISVPRSTAIITEDGNTNMRPGVFKGGRFDEEWSRQEVDRMARELTSGSYMYNKVTVYYGTKASVEYYIVAERSY